MFADFVLLFCLSWRIFLAEVNIWKRSRTVHQLNLVDMLSENICLVSTPCLGPWAADHRGGGNRTDDPARLGVHQQAIAGRRHCRWCRRTRHTVVGLIKKDLRLINTAFHKKISVLVTVFNFFIVLKYLKNFKYVNKYVAEDVQWIKYFQYWKATLKVVGNEKI